jgi:hypothetical protein
VILQTREGGSYQWVRDAYIHGLMDGKSMQDFEKKFLSPRSIHSHLMGRNFITNRDSSFDDDRSRPSLRRGNNTAIIGKDGMPD